MRGPIDLLNGAWGVFTTNPKLFLGIYAIPWVVTALYTFVVEAQGGEEVLFQTSQGIVVFLAALAVMMLVNIFAGIAMIKAVADPQSSTVGNTFAVAKRYFVPYVVVAILVGLVTMVGFILLIIPGILFAVWFSFTYYMVLLEEKRGTDAMKASRELVRGHWWGVFGRFLFITLVAIVAGGVVGGFLGAAVATFSEIAGVIVASAIQFVLVPVSVAYGYLMYKDLSTLPAAEEKATEAEETVSEESQQRPDAETQSYQG